MPKPSYSANFEILTALITYMATDKFVLHQPKWFANQLSMDVSQIKPVLEEFKGLFRRSKKTSKDYEEPYYSLHLRNARQEVWDGNTNVQKPALELQELMELLKFVADKARDETSRWTGIVTATAAAAAAIAASLITVFFTALR